MKVINFLRFINEGRATDPIAAAAKAAQSGKYQYSLAARLAIGENPNLGYADTIRGVEEGFGNNPQSREHQIQNTSIRVGRFNRPDKSDNENEPRHDLTYSKNGKIRRVEAIGGAGKMLWSKRTGATKLSFEQLTDKESHPLLAGIVNSAIENKGLSPTILRGRLQGTRHRRLTSPVTEEDIKSLGLSSTENHVGIVHRDPSTNVHTGMEYLEKHINNEGTGTTHWAIGDHLVPVGALKHFVGKMVITQGSHRTPRIALRVGSVVDPLEKVAEGKTKTHLGTEKTWHTTLNNILHAMGTKDEGRQMLERLGIEKIPDIN